MSVAPQTLRRLAKEIRTLQVNPPDGVAVEINEADLLAVRGWVRGPQGTAFEGGSFLVTFEFTSEFPAVPPRCRMSTKIFHPNVSSAGEICVSTLKKDWQPKYGIGHILTVIKCLLISPNPDSALNAEAGRLLQEDYAQYEAMAKMWSKIHADRCPPGLFPESIEESAGTREAAPLTGLGDANSQSKVLLASVPAVPFELMQPQMLHQRNLPKPVAPCSQFTVPGAKRVMLPKASTVVKRGIKRL
ncbi:unnamed protein product [Jaminaea pallidilutea]